MKIKNSGSIEKFNPNVLKNMILFSIRSKRAFTFQKDIMTFEKKSTVYEFIANFYLDEVKKVIMTKPDKKYNELTDDLYYVKGKINIKKTILNTNNRVNCTFGELSLNNQLNRIVKYILYYLYKDKQLKSNKNLSRKIINEYYFFENVDLVDVSIKDILGIRLNKDNMNYETLLLLSRYIIGCIKYSENTKEKYIDIDSELWWVYQEFIRNYYDYYKEDLHIKNVSPSKYEWNLEPILNAKNEYLPKMRTDIEVNSLDQYLIIDAKCYENSLLEYYGKKIFHSGNLYQVKSYLDVYKIKNSESNKRLRGILIYPFNHKTTLNAGNNIFYDKDEDYTLEIYTINFKNDWDKVCEDLNSIIFEKESYDYILRTFKNES